MRYRIVLLVLGVLLIVESIFMLLSTVVAIIYGGNDIISLLAASAITGTTGAISYFLNRKTSRQVGKKEAYIIVSLGWIVLSFFGAIPFIWNGYISNFTDAFFETISGFTTTGASILIDIEALPHGILFWRSITQWMGGMGIIVLSIAILPLIKVGGMQLFVAEVPGPTPDKLHPKVKETAKRLWLIYVLFTFLETILLWIGGMSLFDSINHAFTTMATGGYSTKQASIAYYQSPYIHYVITVFMFIAGTNFTLSYFALKGKFRKILKNDEFKFYLKIVITSSIILAVGLAYWMKLPIEHAFRDAIFQVISIVTTTGFVTSDYALWQPLGLSIIIFALMFIGGSAGSTGGGIKVVRIQLLFRNSYLELKRLIHPNAVIPVRYNGKAVHSSVINNILAFVIFYFIIFMFSTIVISFFGLDLQSSMGAVAATLGNIGPGLGSVGPSANYEHLPNLAKWFLSFLMLLGRLELFTVLVILAPSFWKK